jgi:hypothetical protein
MLSQPDVEFGSVPPRLASAVYLSALIEASAGQALLRLPSVGRYLVRPARPVVVERAPGASDEDVDCFLRGPVAALAALQRGQFALRGAAVEIRDRALVVCSAGSGASALAAALACRGHRVLADRVVVVDERLAMAPGHPEVTLWPDVVAALGLDPASGRPVRPALASRRYCFAPTLTGVAPPVRATDAVCVPLAATIVLGVDPRLGGDGPTVTVTEVGGHHRLELLTGAEWYPYLVDPLGLASQHFAWAASVAGTPMTLAHRAHGPLDQVLATLADRAEEMVA